MVAWTITCNINNFCSTWSFGEKFLGLVWTNKLKLLISSSCFLSISLCVCNIQPKFPAHTFFNLLHNLPCIVAWTSALFFNFDLYSFQRWETREHQIFNYIFFVDLEWQSVLDIWSSSGRYSWCLRQRTGAWKIRVQTTSRATSFSMERTWLLRSAMLVMKMRFWWKVWCAKSWWRRVAWWGGKMIRKKIKPHKSSYQIWCLGSWRRADLWWR